jgi:hypothetical protein
MPDNDLGQLRQAEYRLRLTAGLRRREVFALTDPNSDAELVARLEAAELALSGVEQRYAQAIAADQTTGLLLDNTRSSNLLGAETTGLEVTVFQRLASIPTAIVHLFDPQQHPLVTIKVRNAGDQRTRRLRLFSYIEGYSAQAVDTLELAPRQQREVNQLPVLFPAQARDLTELTRASLNLLVEDLDGGVELHTSLPVWLLSRNSAPLAMRDPHTGGWNDLSMYFGAFVTPNSPAVMRFLRLTAEHHPERRLVGYQGEPQVVEPQVQAAYDALQTESRITYVNSVLEFNPEQGFATQRVRLPRESLEERQANCIDGVVLFASLLESMSLSPAILVVPGHALLGWETWEASGEWRFLETTMINSHTFAEATASGQATAERYRALAERTGGAHYFRLHPLRELRGVRHVTPLE